MLIDFILFSALVAVLASADVSPFQYWAVMAIALALKYLHY